MSEETSLKSCPFCGKIPTINSGVDDWHGPYVRIICECGIEGPMFEDYDYPFKYTKEEATKHWNTRPFSGREQAELVYAKVQCIQFKLNVPDVVKALYEFERWLSERKS